MAITDLGINTELVEDEWHVYCLLLKQLL